MENKRVVITKVGTECLCNDAGKISISCFQHQANQAGRLAKKGIGLVVISSGAIQCGKEYLSYRGITAEGISEQVLAGIGTTSLFKLWSIALSKVNLVAVPCLISESNLTHSVERQTVRASIIGALSRGFVSVINENDMVSDREISMMHQGISENDCLTAHLAELLCPWGVLFQTMVGGVFEQDPRTFNESRLYAELTPEKARELVKNVRHQSTNGRGGMKPKLLSALECTRFAERVAIVPGRTRSIVRFAREEPVGTLIGKTTRFA